MPFVDPIECEVLVNGRWVRGVLLGWTRRDRAGSWIGVVRYSVAAGQTYEQARPVRQIRRRVI